MAAIIELKYFNTFWLKKVASIVEQASPPPIGQEHGITTYPGVPQNYLGDTAVDWYIEEARIRGGYNNTSVDFGVKAYIVEDNTSQQHLISSIIYSGIYNSRTGVNDTNQFSVGEDITKTVDPVYASIQRLYAEDTNLIIFQENKVSKALIDKDAIYSAEGTAAITSTQLVIGQVVAYAGEYGISTDPFSFAVYGYRKYFTDRKRNAVLRLSKDGITEISSYGMLDFFRDELSDTTNSKVVGGFDVHTKNYIVAIQRPFDTAIPYRPLQSLFQDPANNPPWYLANRNTPASNTYKTVSFDESVNGWTSFFSYPPTFFTSLNASFYTLFQGGIWLHHTLGGGLLSSTTRHSTFYKTTYNSSVTLVLNADPSVVKNFKTINYEGGADWLLESMVASSGDIALPVSKYAATDNYAALENNMFANNFKRKENKFFANVLQNTTLSTAPQDGEILWGYEVGGLKGFFTTVKMALNNSGETGKKELFAVSSNTVQSSY